MFAFADGRRWGASVLLVLGLLLGFLGGFGGAMIATVLFDEDDTPVTTLPAAGFAEQVAENATASVVTILTETTRRREDGVYQETSIGSGVIVDPRGFIVTNEHVIRGAGRLTVVLSTGEERRGELVSHDWPFTDLAVVRMQGASDLPALPLGDSDALRLGQPLVVIGHSLRHLSASVTTGVVSGLHRDWPREDRVMEDLIQTDAAINHGNSGGAVLNDRGELVGLTTTVIRQTEDGEAVEGIGLAISSRTIRDVALTIIDRGRKLRPTIGIEHQDIDPETAEANGLPPIQAAFVVSVGQGSPAERAGMRANDLILAIDGKELTPERPYVNLLMRVPVDRPVPVQVVRGGVRQTLSITPVLR